MKSRLYNTHRILQTSATFVLLAMMPAVAHADPQGGTVIGGGASISSANGNTVIDQSSDRALIRWDSFDIDAAQHVQFRQPSSSSITVNRITDTKASRIDGRLSANGNIVLINPNGMVFGASAIVDVGGLVATSSDLEDDTAFMNGGDLKFTKPGNPGAQVINNGTMTVRDAGLAGLVAPHVENNGVIQARMGRVQLASGDIHTIDFAGDGLIKLEVSDNVAAQAVINRGKIEADGGAVLVTAALARQMVDSLIDNSGIISANTVAQNAGRIIFSGSKKTINTGTLQAAGDDAGEAGGSITVLADEIMLGDGSVVEASGDTNGGVILVGGDYQGGSELPASDSVYVAQNVILNARSRRNGQGGTIVTWSDKNTQFYGHADSRGGSEGGNGGLVEISGKNYLDFRGTANLKATSGTDGTLLLDPTNITINSNADTLVSGTSPFTPSGDDVTSFLNAGTLLAALANGNVIVQTRATGGQSGNITVDSALTWASGNTLTLDAHNQIIINAAISGGSLEMIAGGDVVLNNTIAGNGTLTIQQRADGTTIGIGASAVGVVNLNAADLGKIQDGWSNVILGRQTATAAMDIRDTTWTDNLTLRSGTGTINVNGTTTVGANNLTIIAGGDINVPTGKSLTGTGILTITPSTTGTSVGLGGGAGNIALAAAEIPRITANWNKVVIGRTDSTATVTMAAQTWSDPLTILNGTGLINVSGVQTMGTNALGFITDGDITLGVTNTLFGSTTLTFETVSAGVGIGLGDSQAGALNLTSVEVGRIRDGWASIVFGRTDGTAAINVGTTTWTDAVTLQTGSGAININATPTMGGNNLVMTTTGGNILIAGAISQTSGVTSMTVGGAGKIDVNADITLTTGALTMTTAGGAINIAAALNGTTTGAWALNSNNGLITIGGNVTRTGGSVTLNAGTGNIIVNNAMSFAAGSASLITSGAGTIAVNNTLASTTGVLAMTTAGGAINIAAPATISQTTGNVTINSGGGAISVLSALTQTSGASGAVTINSNNGAIQFNGAITRLGGSMAINAGTGSVIVNNTVALGAANLTVDTAGSAAISFNNTVGSGAGNITLTTAGGNVTLAQATTITGAGALSITSTGGAVSTKAISQTTGNLTISSGGGAITVDGALTQTSGASGNLNITSGNGAIDIKGALTRLAGTATINAGSGGFTARDTVSLGAANTTIDVAGSSNIALNSTVGASTGNIGLTTAAGNVVIGGAFTQTGTGNLTINTTGGLISTKAITQTTGATAMNSNGGTITVGGALAKTGGALTVSSGAGQMTFAGAVGVGAGSATFTTDSNIALGGALSGTGALVLAQASDNVSLGIGTGQAGTVHLDDTEFGYIQNGWASRSFGRSDSTAALNVKGGLVWDDTLVLQTGTGLLSLNGAQTVSGSLTLRTDSDVNILGTLSGTGAFALVQSSTGTSMGIGDGQAGTVNLTTDEKNYLATGWTSRTFGRIDSTGAMNVANLSWTDPLVLRTGSGQMTIAGITMSAGRTLALITDSDLSLTGNVTGSGSGSAISIYGATASATMGIGDGQAGMIQLSNAELTRLGTSWNNIYMGTTTTTGNINIGSRTWSDPLNIRTSSGIINVNGVVSMGSNNLSITTDGDMVIGASGGLSGTGTLTIAPTTATTSYGLGDGQGGSITWDNAEISRINNTWGSIIIGATTSTGSMNVGSLTLNDNVTLRTGSGAMNINGAVIMGANNLSLTTNSNIAIGAALTGTGSLTIQGATAATSIGVGTGQAGTLSLSDGELDLITTGWTNVIFGTTSMTGAMNIAGRTWNNSVDFRTSSGALNINGAQNMGANNLTIRTSTNLSIGQILAGTGTLSIMPATSVAMGVGDGQGGTLNLSNAEMDMFKGYGWSTIAFGNSASTAALNFGGGTWSSNLVLRTAGSAGTTLNINGVTNVGARNVTLQSNEDIVVNQAINGTGTLSIGQIAATVGLGIGDGQSGAVAISNAELALLNGGWSSRVFGTTATTTSTYLNINIGANTWNSDVTVRSSGNAIVFNGIQNFGAHNLLIETNANPSIGFALNGTGELTVRQYSAGTTMNVGGTGGTVNLSDSEVSNLGSGWSKLNFGRSDGTAAMTVADRTWNNNVFITNGTGSLSIAGADMGSKTLEIASNANLAINGDLDGTGTLIIRNAGGLNEIGVGTGQAGTLQLDATELGRIKNGWSEVQIGSASSFGKINIAAATWLNPMKFLSQSDIVINGVQNTTETGGTTMVFATTGGKFINNAGAGGINPGGGRYLVYSIDENNDTLGGLTRPTILTNVSYSGYGPSSVTEPGDVYIYAGTAAKILYLLIDNVNKAYGDTNPTYTYSYVAGLQNGDLLNDIVLSASMNAAGSNVLDDAGTIRVINGTFNLGDGYALNLITGTLTVTKATVTVEADSTDREYGIANPVFSISYNGFKNGDDESALASQATAVSTATIFSNVGNYAITSSGAADNNYDFVYVNGNLEITKADLTATVQSTSREYGDSNPAFTINYTGFRNTDNAGMIDTKATASSVADATSNVGSYAITAAGAIDNNYNFHYINGSLSVTKAMLTATTQNETREYGLSNPALSVVYTGFKNNETVDVIDTKASIVTGAVEASNVGSYAITSSGAVDNNYNFTYANTGNLSVTKAMLTVTAEDKNRIYGDSNPALTVAYSGFRNNENNTALGTQATAATVATELSNAGNHAITVGGAAATNYNFTYVAGNLAIGKADLTATVLSDSREYGDANPGFTINYTGFRNTDNAGMIDTKATAASVADLTSNVGSYAITLGGAVDNNYNFNYVGGTLSVTKAMLTVTSQNETREYGLSNPALTLAYTGFKNNETVNVIDTKASAATGAIISSNVGSYGITGSGASDDNYDFTYVDSGNLTITKAMLTVTAEDKSRIYGAADPAFTVAYSGFRNNETDAVLSTHAVAGTGATVFSHVGDYAITASGADAINYDFTYADGNLAIGKATLVATAGSDTREYGEADPVLGVTYSGFVNNDDELDIDTLAAATGPGVFANAGTQAVTAGSGFDNNYTFSYVNGAMIVTKALLTATADDATRSVGAANPGFAVTYTGFKNNENSSVIDTAATASSIADNLSPVGTYLITASGAADNNYDFAYADGTLTLTGAVAPPPIPPTPVPPAPTVPVAGNNNTTPPVVIPATAEDSPNTRHAAIPQLQTKAFNMFQAALGKGGIVVIADDSIYNQNDADNKFLIAITNSLETFEFGYSQDEESEAQ